MSVSPIQYDTFTDTDSTALTSHTSDSGGTWTESSGDSGTAWAITNNEVVYCPSNSSFNGSYIQSSPQSQTDTTVMVDQTFTGSAPGVTYPIMNCNTSGTNSYSATVWFDQTNYRIYRQLSGSFTELGSSQAVGSELISNTSATTIRLCRRTSGGTATITMIVNGRQVLSVTDSSPLTTLYSGMYANGSVAGTFDNWRVFNSSQEIGVVLIGDSVTYGAETYTGLPNPLTNPPDTYYGLALSRGKSGLPVVVFNHGVSGTTSLDWVNGTNGANLSSAISALSNQPTGNRWASIMLGANDAKITPQTSQSTYSVASHLSNMTSIISTLKSNGIKVILNRPIYLTSSALTVANGGAVWNTASVQKYLPGYWEADQSLVDNINVFMGDTQAYDIFYNNSASNGNSWNGTTATGDGAHPNQQFSAIMSQCWADAAYPILSGAVALPRTRVTAF